MSHSSEHRIAVCFFGITRSLTHTIASIRQNVLEPARRRGQVRVYAHFFQVAEIDDPRSGEKGRLDTTESMLLAPDLLMTEPPDLCLRQWDVDGLKQHGDYWKNDFRTLGNLIHQLHSLDRVTEAVLADQPDICLFCRPDLLYHDTLDRHIQIALRARAPLVQLPYWQPWHALNDRFALVTGQAAIAAYGQRIRLAHAFCEEGRPLHSERLLQFALAKADLRIRTIGARASRIRLGGIPVDEHFTYPGTREFRRKYHVNLDPLMRLVKRFV